MANTPAKTSKSPGPAPASKAGQPSSPRSLSQHSEAELGALRSKLEMISLVSLLATDAIFGIVWAWTFPELLWIAAVFIAGTLAVWLLFVMPQIRSFGKPKN